MCDSTSRLNAEAEKPCSAKTDLEATNIEDEAIMDVPLELAKWSLGFAFDMGGSVAKLVYRSKEDYENGILKDVNSPVGKLRLRYLKNNDMAGFVQFLERNCDTILTAPTAGVVPSEQQVWCQTGVSYANNRAFLEDKMNIRLGVIFETTAMFHALRAFHTDPAASSFFPRPLPMSERAVSNGRDDCIQMVNATNNIRLAGDEFVGSYANRSRNGFDSDAYKTSLTEKNAFELVSEMTVMDFREPFLFVVLGSATQIYHVQEDGKSVMINLMRTSCKSFLRHSLVLTQAKDFSDLADMIGRGKSRNVDEHTNDILSHAEDKFYSEIKDDMLIFPAGKLGQDKYKGTYTNDDIAASLALSFCSTTSKLVILCAQQQNVKSVVFCGGFLCHPATRECLEESFTAESLILPFTGFDVIKMVILPNPGHLGALGIWQYNWDLEQQKKQNNI